MRIPIKEKCYLCEKTFSGKSQNSIQRQKARHLVNDCKRRINKKLG